MVGRLMARVVVDQVVEVGVPARELWDYVTDWEKHAEWIPFTRAETVGGAAHGVGGKLRAWSGVGPIGFWDPLTVTEWEEQPDGGGRASLVHTGRWVKGDAELVVEALGDRRSALRWVEHLQLGRAAGLAWKLAGPVLERGFARALRRMAAILEAP